MKVRIKIGSQIMQDRSIGRWPACFPPGKPGLYEADDPNMVFEADLIEAGENVYWDCRADGFGARTWKGEAGAYGSGSIFVTGRDGVEVVGANAMCTPSGVSTELYTKDKR